MPRRIAIGAAVVLVAAVALLAAALSPWSHDDPGPHLRVTLSFGAAPTGTVPASQRHVFGSSETPVQVTEDILGRPGREGRASELAPLAPSAFRRPISTWRRYALRQAAGMRRAARALEADVRARDRRAARAAWTRAYAGYLRTGLAYGALGDLDATLAAVPGSLRRGRADRHFAGLHRVEAGLWTGAPLPRVLPWARRLADEVDRLPHAIRTLDVTPLDYATRAHEILEDVQRDQLSGAAPRWSRAGVVATAAGLEATERVLRTLDPLLAGRGDAQAVVATRVGELDALLRRIHAAHHGHWPATDALTRAERERLEGSLGAALEALSAVPAALETTRPPIVAPLP